MLYNFNFCDGLIRRIYLAPQTLKRKMILLWFHSWYLRITEHSILQSVKCLAPMSTAITKEMIYAKAIQGKNSIIINPSVVDSKKFESVRRICLHNVDIEEVMNIWMNFIEHIKWVHYCSSWIIGSWSNLNQYRNSTL